MQSIWQKVTVSFLLGKGLKGRGYKAGELCNSISLRNGFKGHPLIKAATWHCESG